MTNIQKIIFGVLIVLAVGAIVSVNRPANQTNDITLGFIGPFSGDAASLGETEKNATLLALAEINSKPHKYNISISYEDSQCNPRAATTAIEKIIAISKPKVILGGVCSTETLAVAPMTQANRILLFSSWSSNPSITNSGDLVFRNAPSDNDIAKADADILVKRGHKRIAIISEQTDYSLGVLEVMLKTLKESGIAPIANETYAGTARISDFRTVLLKVKALNPDAVYVNPGTSLSSAGLLVKQGRELGITSAMYGNYTLGTTESLLAGGSAVEGAIYSDGAALSAKGTITLEAYKKMFGKDPNNNLEMGLAYDRMMIVSQAIEKVGYDADKIRDYLYGMGDYEGAGGTYHFDQNGDPVGISFIHKIIKGGKGEFLPE